MPLKPFFYIASFFGIYFSTFLLITLFENRKNLTREPKEKDFPSLTVIIPCFNEEDSIKPTVNQLLETTYPLDKLQVFIVNDGSEDNTYQKALELKDKYPQVKVFSKENGGKYTALNYGIKRTDTKLIATLDADCFVDPEALEKMVAYFSDPETQAVTSSVKVHTPETIWQHFQNALYLFVLLLRKTFSFFGSVKVTPGPLSIFRRKIIEKVGYYHYGHQTEDIEMGLRLQDHDCQIEHALDAYVYTVTPRTFKGLHKQRVRWAYGGIRNLWDYKHLFGPKHGNLGLLVLPANLISFFTLPVSVIVISSRLVSKAIQYIQKWNVIGSLQINSFSSLIPNLSFMPHPLLLIAVSQVILTFLFILCSKKVTSDQSKLGRSLVLTAFFAFPLFSLWLFNAFYRIIINQKINW